jgi:hypothetical protein
MKLSIAVLTTLLAASQAFAFGTQGQSGSSGRSGYSGTDGQNIQLFAHELTQLTKYNLDGDRGHDGSEGYDGQDATSCYYSEGEESIVGADAGAGGDGGDGGSGGDGGRSVIYYSDIAQLKKLMITAIPGQGGYASYGGRGGSRGCYCNRPYWYVQKCHDEMVPDTRPPECDRDGKPIPRPPISRRVCEDHTYTCTDGRAGNPGRRGSDGSRGSYGYLTLIKSDSELLEETSSGQMAINKLTANVPSTHVLTENLFEGKSGANALLAPGSQVADRYNEFSRRAIENVHVLWTSTKEAHRYFGTVYSYISNGQVSFRYTSDDILITEEKHEGTDHTFIIKDAYKFGDFTQLALRKSGSGKRTQIIATAPTPNQNLVKDQFTVRITYIRWLLPDKVVFSNTVPENLIQRGKDQTTINLGQLRFEDSSSIWNKKLLIEFKYTRNVKGASGNAVKNLIYTQQAL